MIKHNRNQLIKNIEDDVKAEDFIMIKETFE